MSSQAATQEVVLDPEEFYRTDNMGMASWLKMQGHTPQRVRWEDQTCYWYFDKSDLLLGSVDAFLEGEARVEPKEYNRIFLLTKREFWDSAPPGQRSGTKH